MARPILTDNLPRLLNEIYQRIDNIENSPKLLGQTIIEEQQVEGVTDAYRTNFTAGAGYPTVMRDTTGSSTPLEITCTPTVNAWWEVHSHVGIVVKTDANYHYMYLVVTLSPAPPAVTGATADAARAILTQHSAVQNFEPRTITRRFPLTAGITYTARSSWSGSGGTWDHFCGPGYMWMQGKVWGR